MTPNGDDEWDFEEEELPRLPIDKSPKEKPIKRVSKSEAERIAKEDEREHVWEIPSDRIMSPCACPVCKKTDLDQVEESIDVAIEDEGSVELKKMRCRADSTIFYCKMKEPKSCECPVCKAKPGKGLTKIAEEDSADGKFVHYKCDKGDVGPVKCPNYDDCVVECIHQTKPGECICPTCQKFNADEVPGSRVEVQPGVWQISYKCRDDGTKFECQKQECRCSNCGSNNMTEKPGGREEMADGSIVVTYICGDCNTEFKCREKPGKYECKCPTCNKPVDEKDGEFERIGEPETMADGTMVITYLHKPDNTTFKCTSEKKDTDLCACPICKSTNYEEINRRTVMGKIVLTVKCLDCDPGGANPFDCTLSEPCFCKTCASGEFLEEIPGTREERSGGARVHFRCTKGHTDRDAPCHRKIPGCVACCIEISPPPGCACPKCGAVPGNGLIELGESDGGPECPGTIVHYACGNCNYVRGACSTGEFIDQEAVECCETGPRVKTCPNCGSTNIHVIKVVPGEKFDVYEWECRDCGG